MGTKQENIERLRSIMDRQIHRIAYLLTYRDDDVNIDLDKCLEIKHKAEQELNELEEANEF